MGEWIVGSVCVVFVALLCFLVGFSSKQSLLETLLETASRERREYRDLLVAVLNPGALANYRQSPPEAEDFRTRALKAMAQGDLGRLYEPGE